ncbi:methyl-CpG-binding domain protein 1b isoform X1 [Pygocentrus nattereri]|uniref:Methyl-CpG binding domain protein 1b n=2 Tax=Pygocentrus nattereri TaxID=42514 RepID=A0A3B4CLW6_PYGNA|nr:methyl-CpG-binding domain protein 1b isoform X1 [Pygocentrus nattereri]XP_017580662.1 methyl-CpG-binding domain protein 1b isoform X1 [Pygocentrus nattereri]XP_017580663.1 methyl-CpG-binding domain protein 1b isoform X1 [Pygocentrus nattereri]
MEKEAQGGEGPSGQQRMEENISNTEDKKSLSSSTDIRDNDTDRSAGQALSETGSELVKGVDEPPADWFEPLEEDCVDDDVQSCDLDMESLAGSERSGSVAGSEWNHTGSGTVGRGRKPPRRRVGDEDWEDWPILGEGWKRRVVLRRSGMSMGQIDTYYMSPKGERVRSKIELLKCIKNTIDLTHFDFKMGKFFDGEPPKRGPRKRRMGRSSPADCGFSSESSFQNESADAADRTYSPGPMFNLGQSAQSRVSSPSKQKDSTSSPAKSHDDPSLDLRTPSTTPNSQNGPSNGGFPSKPSDVPVRPKNDPAYIPPNAVLGICVRCRNSFTGVEGQTMCGKCSRACNASKDNRNIIFRKWLPCGFCRACQLTEDCGTCASCRNGKLNPDARRPVRCRKRKCLCPTLKRKSEDMPPATQYGSMLPRPERRLSERSETTSTVSKMSALQYSDSDEQSPFYDDDDDDDDDDEEERVVKKQRRSCGRCKGCVSKADCGICDFCIDKPKFGGSNKKRQKCRRRQCQREAMRHLLPDSGHTPVLTPQGWVVPGRPRPIYAYGRKKAHQSREKWDFDFSDNEGELERRIKGPAGMLHLDRDKISSSNYKGQLSLPLNTARSNKIAENGLQAKSSKILPVVGAEVGARRVVTEALFEEEPLRPRAEERTLQGYKEQEHTDEQEEDEAGPTITQIFSLGRSGTGVGGVELEPELLELLSSLRRAVLPVLWCPVLVEGPRLQLLQCSKLSAMADTAVYIEPNFRFHISVQGQPLLPTHRLYLVHPPRLSSAAQVAALLEDLERYAVCRGFEAELPTGPDPIIQERAATCEFLVLPDAKRCGRCKSGEQKQ